MIQSSMDKDIMLRRSREKGEGKIMMDGFLGYVSVDNKEENIIKGDFVVIDTSFIQADKLYKLIILRDANKKRNRKLIKIAEDSKSWDVASTLKDGDVIELKYSADKTDILEITRY